MENQETDEWNPKRILEKIIGISTIPMSIFIILLEVVLISCSLISFLFAFGYFYSNILKAFLIQNLTDSNFSINMIRFIEIILFGLIIFNLARGVHVVYGFRIFSSEADPVWGSNKEEAMGEGFKREVSNLNIMKKGMIGTISTLFLVEILEKVIMGPISDYWVLEIALASSTVIIAMGILSRLIESRGSDNS